MRGTPEEKPIAFLMLRTMQKARYDPANLGHFGLAAEQLHALHLADPPLSRPGRPPHAARVAPRADDRGAQGASSTDDLPEIARHTSERERRADDAERELVQWKKVRFMADKVGDEFEGYVTGVTAFGLFIELIEHFVEGLVHVSTMADDYYRFVERAHILRGENTGKVYRLGDECRCRSSRSTWSGGRSISGWSRSSTRVRESEQNRGPRRSKAQPQAGARQSAAKRKQRPGKRERAGQQQARAERASEGADRRVRSIVIGTAGHIDHGKSALVRALTGTDPDRLKEEQARGITIDLGFAHLEADGVEPRVRGRARATSGSSRTCSPAPAASTS